MQPNTQLTRRAALGVLGAGGLFVASYKIAGGGGDDSSTASAAAPADTASTDAGTAIPEETGGPFPADGTNGPDALAMDGVVRSDITTSFGEFTGTADGVPLDVDLRVVEAGSGDPMPGTAVYLWHCTQSGGYSMYQDLADQNYLRGVQEADADGNLRFTTIFPAAYDGRWPHAHLEVYASVDEATGGGTPLATSQLAFPEDVCDEVYATDGYEASIDNLARTSLTTDMVFSDGVDQQTPTITGSVADGLVASLVVPV
jgi:protocatechuate 3,4-dioxygenase beta subunit